MTEAWLVTGVDAETRRRTAASAERLGLSLADYITEIILESGASAPPQPGRLQPDRGAAEKPLENLEVRRQLELLRQELKLSAPGFHDAATALDSPNATDPIGGEAIEHTAGELQIGLLNASGAGRERQSQAEPRISAVEAKVADHSAVLSAIREAVDALEGETAARATRQNEATAHIHRLLSDDIARIEACTLAALEKLSADIRAGGATLSRYVDGSENAANRIDGVESRLDSEIVELHGQYAGAMARLQLIDRTLGNLGDAPTATILDRLSSLEHELGVQSARLDLADVQSRLADLETRQAETLEALHADLANFVRENERRLAALEACANAAPLSGSLAASMNDRLAQLENQDLATAFENLRQRLDDRLLGVELRGLRTLEQLEETIGLIENRFADEAGSRESQSA